MHNHHDAQNDHYPEPPPENISNLPPQLEASICSHAERCECNHDIDGGGDESSESDGTLSRSWQGIEDYASSNGDDDSDYMDGDEGLERNHMEGPHHEYHDTPFGNHGLPSLAEIHEARARYDVCTCQHTFPIGVLPDEYMLNGTSPMRTGSDTPCSLCVEPGSLEHSMFLTPPIEAPVIFTTFVRDSYFPATPANHMFNPVWPAPVFLPPYLMQLGSIDEDSNRGHSA